VPSRDFSRAPQEGREHLAEPEPFACPVDLVDEQVISDHAVKEPASVILAVLRRNRREWRSGQIEQQPAERATAA